MKSKKLASLLLAVVIALPTVLAACGETNDGEAKVSSIAIVKEGLQTTYTVGDTFDYAAVDLKVTYSDKSTKTLNLESEGVTHTTLDMNTAGKQTLTATYEKKSDSVEITVAAEAVESTFLFSMDEPQSYANLQRTDDEDGTQSEDRDLLMKGIEHYEVGIDNGFVFVPEAYALSEDGKGIVPVTNVETVFDLYIQGENGNYPEAPEATPETYVTTKEGQNNVYYFTEEAVGKVVKLIVSPSEKYDLSFTSESDVTFDVELLIVDGYNVYDQLGLSVFDNLNVKHWAEIKEAAGTLAWDLKPLKDYNDVKTVILHNNITIDPDQLPDYFFWDKDRNVEGTWTVDDSGNTQPIGNQGYDAAYDVLDTEDDKATDDNDEPIFGYAEKLNGSLRDWSPSKGDRMTFDDPMEGDQKEDYEPSAINMQKGIYCSTGTGISGNGMRLGYKLEGTKHKLYTVLDDDGKWKASPKGHWSMFQYQDYTGLELEAKGYPLINESKPVVKNVKIIGESPRLARTYGDPAHLMAFNIRAKGFTLKNSTITQLYVAFTGDEPLDKTTKTATLVEDSKFYDFYSNVVYSWRSPFVINNTIMKEAGGPIFILVDGSRTGTANDNDGPSITVDDKSVLESWAMGNEPWYKAYNAESLFNNLTGQLRTATRSFLGRDIVTVDENSTEIVNVIAALVPNPDNLMKSYSAEEMLLTSGIVKRTHADGTVEEFRLNPTFPDMNLTATLPVLGEQTIPFDTLLYEGLDLSAIGMGVIPGLMTSEAPFFYSGKLLAGYVGTGFAPFGYAGPMLGATANGISGSTDALTATWAAAATDWMMINMRAMATSPRFGVLIGNVHSVTAG